MVLESKSENLVFYQIFLIIICLFFYFSNIKYKLLVILFGINLYALNSKFIYNK